MTTWLDQIAGRAVADAPAVVEPDRTWSGRELVAGAAGVAALLDEVRAEPGVPVVALVHASAQAFALAIACAATDRPVAPLGPRLTPAELVPCVEALPGSVLVVDDATSDLGREVANAAGRDVVVLPPFPELPSAAAPLALGGGDPTRPAAILHTSGTTGRPKAVPYTLGPLARRVEVNARLVELGPGAVYATASPFHHIAGLGMLFVALGSGAALAPMPRFDVDEWQALRHRGVTHALAVPTMIEMLLDSGALALPDLRVLQYGGAPIRPSTLERVVDVLPDVRLVQIFGQTEGSPITCLTPEDHERAVGGEPGILASVGRAAPGVEIAIDAPDEAGIGEIHARGAHLFGADPDGRLRTGDLGRVDGEGFVYLSGRKGDKIIRGGENVYPGEVEEVLAGHPHVAEACVYAVPDPRLGETVGAALVPVEGAPLDVDEIAVYARQRLAGFKVPQRWRVCESLPRNPTGKVLRRTLAAEAAAT